jgi:hypothetical protein
MQITLVGHRSSRQEEGGQGGQEGQEGVYQDIVIVEFDQKGVGWQPLVRLSSGQVRGCAITRSRSQITIIPHGAVQAKYSTCFVNYVLVTSNT